jgi:hypothetical protein
MGLIFKTPQAGGHVCNCSITGEGGFLFALFQAKDREHCPYIDQEAPNLNICSFLLDKSG